MKTIKLTIQAEDLSTEELIEIGEATEFDIMYIGKKIQSTLPDIQIHKSDVMIAGNEIIFRLLYELKSDIQEGQDLGTTAKISLNEKN